MNISVRVAATQAERAIQQVESRLTRLATAAAASGASGGRANDSLARSFQRVGSQVQWAGRQIAYNFSLPLAAAAAAGAKFALDNERAFTRVSKVYGDGSLAMETVNNELEALKRNFTALSEVYGVNRVEVTNIAADWAAAGASGAALAKSVELTMKTMVLGEMEAADATKALIAIQSQYGFSIDTLTDTIGQLNIVENQTGTSMQDLVDSMSRSAGVARAAGIDVRHLAAMTAALVPAAGTASQAGNALKTIISRLLSPTQEATQILNEMGIATDSMAWASADGAARVKILSEQYEGLSDAQKAVASAALGGRQQLNKFEVLLKAVAQDGEAAGTSMSYYYKALEATSDSTAYMLQLQKELDTVLASNPKKWDTVKVMLQNALADAIAPLLPYLIGMAREVANLAKKWGELDPSVQKAIGAVALLLIVIGPAMSLIGAFITLVGYLGTVFLRLISPITFVVGALWSLVSALVITPLITAATFAIEAFALVMTTLSAAIFASIPLITSAFRIGFAMMPLVVLTAGAAIQAAWTAALTAVSAITAAWGPTFRAMWATIQFALAVITAEVGAALRLAWVSILSGLSVLTATWGTAMGVIWRTMGLSWAVGLRSPYALMLAMTTGFGATMGLLWRGTTNAILLGVLQPFRIVAVALWRALNVAIATIQVAFGPVIAGIWATISGTVTRIWTMLSISMSVISAQMSRGVVIIWQTMTTALTQILLIFAKAAGIIWRAWGVAMAVITAELSAGIAGVWRALQALLVTIQVAGGAALRAAWAATVVGLQAILISGAAAIGAVWRSLQVALVTIQSVVGPALMRMTALLGTGLTMLWGAISTGIAFVWSALGRGIIALNGLMFKGLIAVATRGYAMLISLVSTASTVLMAVMTSPWTWIVLAIIAIIYMLRDKLREVWAKIVAYFQDSTNGIVGAFNNLPKGIQNALIAVVTMIRDAALKVYEWFSYLNPFAHHSPSLVENVTRGMAIVRAEYGKIVDIKGPIDSAYASIKKFKVASRDLLNGMDSISRANDRQSLADAGVSPELLSAFDELVGKLKDMKVRQEALADAVANQEAVVSIWKDRLDAANDTLDMQKDKLEAVQNVADSYKDSIDALKDEISDLASAPLQGMTAMEDALFDNQMAQNKLRLEMLKTAQDGGMSFDDLKSKIASINGAIEGLSGEKAGLRSMGAGGEILSFYDDQISALENQKKALNAAGAPIEKMQTELEKLQQQAEIMDLEKSLKFDPLTRAIDKAANSMAEVPFEATIAKITSNQASIAGLTAKYDQASAAVRDQQMAVDAAQRTHDAIQASYDAENQKLDALKGVYDSVTSSVRDMESALNDATAASKALTSSEYVTPGLQNFRDAAGGDFPEVGEEFNVGREGGLGDQSLDIDSLTAGLNEELASTFDGFDMWGPFKDMWNSVVRWWDENVMPWVNGIGDFFSTAFDDVDLFGGLSGGLDWGGVVSDWWDALVNALQTIWDFGSFLAEWFGPQWDDTIAPIKKLFQDLWNLLAPMWEDITSRVEPFLQALKNLWDIMKPLVAFVILEFAAAFKVLWGAVTGILGPVFDFIIETIQNTWDFIMGILDVFIGLFTGDWERMWDGIKGILSSIWDQFVNIVSLPLELIVGAAKGAFTAIAEIFKWLWEAAIKPVAGWIWDKIKWVGDQFVWLWDHSIGWAVSKISDGFDWLWNTILKPVFSALGDAWNAVGTGMKWVYDSVLKPMFDAFSGIVTNLQTAFQTVVGAIGTAWDGLKRAAAVPINFVIETVLNNGLIKAFNSVVDFFGLDDWKIDLLSPVQFASGGHVNGYSPTNSADNIPARLTAGEYVQPVRAVDRYGTDFMDAIRTGRFPVEAAVGYADGGSVELWNYMHDKFKGAKLNSGYRPGAQDWHGRNKAIDLGQAGVSGGLGNPYMAGMNQWIYDNKKAVTTELIYNGIGDNRMNIKNGVDNAYGAAIQAQHKNHVHLAAQSVTDFINGGSGAAFAGLTGSGSAQVDHPDWWSDPIGYIKAGYESLMSQLDGYGKVGEWMKKTPGKIMDGATDWITDKLDVWGWFSGDDEITGARPIEGAGTSDVREIVKSVAAQRGWDSGVQWQALTALINKESSWNPRAQNPTSTAYGLFQFLNSTWAGTGYAKTSDARTQTQAGLQYIAQRYQNPNKAWQFHLGHNWYDTGGMLPDGGHASNASGRPERILSPRQTIAFERMVDILDSGALLSAVARDRGNEKMSAQTIVYGNVSGDTTQTFNFYGDLEFPEIKDGDDAEVFIRNLSDLAGSR